ncbi:UNVERIFIED_CONTAM: hypothetical protein GTU68_045065 [Idotea baltica]|nr:hypothetical protein [Idotea baltica]
MSAKPKNSYNNLEQPSTYQPAQVSYLLLPTKPPIRPLSQRIYYHKQNIIHLLLISVLLALKIN